jgi:hypothetical protein
MTVIGYKRVAILTSLLSVALLALAGYFAIKSADHQDEERGAWSEIVDYGKWRDEALQSDPEGAGWCLHTITWSPRRTTNSSSPLVWIIERERERDVRDVIEYLRKKTGEDLGDDPAKWIEKYSARKVGERPANPTREPEARD